MYVIFRKKRYKLKISLKKSERPEKFEISEKFIKFIFHNGNINTYSIHDFLQTFECDIGVPTNVHYVGATKNPHDRPINRKHRGVADTLYNVSNDDNDFFLIVSVFKVTSMTLENNSGLSFCIGNSLSNEVPTDSEGRIIEGGFLSYFDSKIQKKERSPERPIFKKELINVKKENNIEYIVFDWEMEIPLEYYKLCSEKIKASDRHVFICKIVDNNVSIEPLDKGFDINRHLREEGNAG